jgi:8-oxo-dGTP diphosphatase
LGETPEACASRELMEELGVVSGELVRMGDHRFQFVDGYSTYVHVYRTYEIEGTAIETDEASPRWCDLAEIPFDDMWEGDRYWLPLVIQDRRFSGYWIFDGDRMVDYRLDILD